MAILRIHDGLNTKKRPSQRTKQKDNLEFWVVYTDLGWPDKSDSTRKRASLTMHVSMIYNV